VQPRLIQWMPLVLEPPGDERFEDGGEITALLGWFVPDLAAAGQLFSRDDALVFELSEPDRQPLGVDKFGRLRKLPDFQRDRICAPHGVLNTRAHGEVTLSRGGHSETYKVEEAGAEDAIPVLRTYIAEIRVTRPYFDATANSSDEALAAELSRHAVFRLIPST
jgi:hypothetical protein